MRYSYPAIIERGEDGRYVVRFPDFAEALTDGADKEEALVEAADCLSEALASRIVDDEEIPSPSPLERGQYRVSPDPIIALKAALHAALRRGGMTIANLADRLGMADWHQAARLIDPKRPSKLRRLAAALDALGYKVEITVSDSVFREQACEALAAPQVPKPEIADRGTVRLGAGCITAEFPPLRQPKPEMAHRGTVRLHYRRVPMSKQCGSVPSSHCGPQAKTPALERRGLLRCINARFPQQRD